MTDLTQLQADLLARVDAAQDLGAVEAVRVEALGKTGSISELLKTLGKMTPDERREQGPKINGLRDAARHAGVPVTDVSETLTDGTDYLTWQRNTVNQLQSALQSSRPARS